MLKENAQINKLTIRIGSKNSTALLWTPYILARELSEFHICGFLY